MTLSVEQQKQLREPFPKHAIGKLPRGGTQLDYVGHAAVTDRLLTVDPAWSWEPVATDDHGLPLFDETGGLWIRLTVCGVTRLGYGDATNGRGVKEVIGDAIRNAAMRFGVAIDLWSKESLLPPEQRESAVAPEAPRRKPVARDERPISEQQRKKLFAHARELGFNPESVKRILHVESTTEIKRFEFEDALAALTSHRPVLEAARLEAERGVPESVVEFDQQGEMRIPTGGAA